MGKLIRVALSDTSSSSNSSASTSPDTRSAASTTPKAFPIGAAHAITTPLATSQTQLGVLRDTLQSTTNALSIAVDAVASVQPQPISITGTTSKSTPASRPKQETARAISAHVFNQRVQTFQQSPSASRVTPKRIRQAQSIAAPICGSLCINSAVGQLDDSTQEF